MDLVTGCTLDPVSSNFKEFAAYDGSQYHSAPPFDHVVLSAAPYDGRPGVESLSVIDARCVRFALRRCEDLAHG